MSSIETLGPGDFGKGTKKRLPVCFCLDISGSMAGARINSLNAAMKSYFEVIKENTEAVTSVDIAVITYGGTVDILSGFTPISKMEVPELKVNKRSYTPMGEGILASLKLLELRKQGYKDHGLKYYQPWLILITDGKPQGPDAEKNFEIALNELNRLENDNKIVVFNIGVGEDTDMESLKRLSTKRSSPISANERNLNMYFQFLGSSSTGVVKGIPTSKLYDELVLENTYSVEKDTDSEKTIAKPSDPSFDISKWCV